MQHVLGETLLITGFVFAMMLLVEFINVMSAGVVLRRLRHGGLGTLAAAAAFGAVPGCLGSFAAVTLYVHGALPFGALVANMIATSGDEAFLMLALFPGRAVALFALLLVWGVLVGWVVQRLARPRPPGVVECPTGFAVHHGEEHTGAPRLRLRHRESVSLQRAALLTSLALFALAVATGTFGPASWSWVRISLLVVTAMALAVVWTVSEHFLEEHLWRHVARTHVPRVFAWVLATLTLLALVRHWRIDVSGYVAAQPLMAIGVAALLGLIPQSGPHMVFVTLYAQGAVPLSVLLTSSVVQDGHGALPLLAESRLEFVKVKAVNLAAGLVLGLAAYVLGL